MSERKRRFAARSEAESAEPSGDRTGASLPQQKRGSAQEGK